MCSFFLYFNIWLLVLFALKRNTQTEVTATQRYDRCARKVRYNGCALSLNEKIAI